MANPTTLIANQTPISRNLTTGYEVGLFGSIGGSISGSPIAVDGLGTYSDPLLTVNLPNALFAQDFIAGNFYIAIRCLRGDSRGEWSYSNSAVAIEPFPSPVTAVSTS